MPHCYEDGAFVKAIEIKDLPPGDCRIYDEYGCNGASRIDGVLHPHGMTTAINYLVKQGFDFYEAKAYYASLKVYYVMA